MKFSAIRPSDPVWFAPIDGDEFEVQIVPEQASQLTDAAGGAIDPEMLTRRVCQRLFVSFRGVEADDGTKLPNTLDNRMAIYRNPKIRLAINAEVWRIVTESAEGESVAATD